MLVPLCREHAPTLRIKVGTVCRATPVSESTTRVIVYVPVAHEVRLAIYCLEGAALEPASVWDIGGDTLELYRLRSHLDRVDNLEPGQRKVLFGSF